MPWMMLARSSKQPFPVQPDGWLGEREGGSVMRRRRRIDRKTDRPQYTESSHHHTTAHEEPPTGSVKKVLVR